MIVSLSKSQMVCVYIYIHIYTIYGFIYIYMCVCVCIQTSENFRVKSWSPVAFTELSHTNNSGKVHKCTLSSFSFMCQSPFFLSLIVMLFYWANLFSISSFSQRLKYSSQLSRPMYFKGESFLIHLNILYIFNLHLNSLEHNIKSYKL